MGRLDRWCLNTDVSFLGIGRVCMWMDGWRWGDSILKTREDGVSGGL